MAFKSGFVAVVGRPNAGKSTLVNALVGRKVAIVTPKPQTTRNRIHGIVHSEEGQIVLIDTPGLLAPRTALERQMTDEIAQALEGIDLLCLVVDATAEFGPGDQHALERVRQVRCPQFLLLNKIDLIEKQKLLPLIERYSQVYSFAEIIPISALTGDGLDRLRQKLLEYLPEGPPYFPPDQVSDAPERFLAAEIIREKAMQATRQEVPHALAVLVDRYEEGEKLVRIYATIYVERDGQKGILIGKGGQMLKRIGTLAREELEWLLGRKVFLELYVKVQPNWRDRPEIVRQLDWRRQLERLS
ncbi:MAG: GTPase Era [Acidobacteriia bacterium]|jgi:GTP-binding protein Era|nr:GTPase Era [Terriglobia bacterium]